MPVVPPKYQGTIEFYQVYRRLISAVKSNETVTYSEIARIMGLSPTGSHMAKQTGWLLGEISEMENQLGRPLLSAIVINKQTKKPGDGFFTLAQQLGKLANDASENQKEAFWEIEMKKVYSVKNFIALRLFEESINEVE